MLTFVFNIQNIYGGNKMIIIEGEKNVEDAIQKAKIETLAPLKKTYGNRKIINLFHSMEYSFTGTVMIKGDNIKTKDLS